MKRSTLTALATIIVMCGTLMLAGCSALPDPEVAEPPVSRPEGLPASAEASTTAAVVEAFFEAANAGDGDAINALFGPDTELFADCSPAPNSYTDIVVGPPVDSDGPVDTLDPSDVRGPSKGPPPERIVDVPVDLKVSGDSPYLPLDEGPAQLIFTLVLNEDGPWLIDLIHMDQ